MKQEETIFNGYYKSSPLGVIEVTATDNALRTLSFIDEDKVNTLPAENFNSVIDKTLHQLDEYFKGERRKFTIPLDPVGTEFQNKVWKYLSIIPYGTTVSYLDIAKDINNVGAIRAVGNANGKNKIAIILPCHRVIGSNGKLTGYAGGIWRKEWLLEHERNNNPAEEQITLFNLAANG